MVKSTAEEANEAAFESAGKAPSPKSARHASSGSRLGLFPKGAELSPIPSPGAGVELSFQGWVGMNGYMTADSFPRSFFVLCR